MMIVALIALLACPAASAQAAQEKKPGVDLKDVNLHDLTFAVQKISKKTILWTEQLGLRNMRIHFVSDRAVVDDPESFFKAYQSILQQAELAIYPIGKPGEEVYKIVQNQKGQRSALPMLKEGVEPEDRLVTRVFSLQHVPVRDVHTALSAMASIPTGIFMIDSAGLIVATDYDYNIKRFEEIIRQMDVKKPDIVLKLVQLEHAIASDVEKMMGDLVRTLITRTTGGIPGRMGGVPGVPGGPGQETAVVVADKRTNAVVLMAEPARLPQLEEIVKRLDSETPFETSGIYISHLRHTNAADVAKTLNAMYRISVDASGVPSSSGGFGGGGSGGGARPGQPVGPAGAVGTTSGGSSSSSGFEGSQPTIVADVRSNSIIIITDRNTYKSLDDIIRRLDQRRPQVLIKATVVEVRSNDKFDWGVELARFEDPTGRTVGGFRQTFGQSIITPDVANNVFNITPVDTPGITMLMLRDRIGNIGAMIKALKDKAKITILDQPEVATSDNGFAEVKLSNQVPVLQATATGIGIIQTTFARFETAETTLMISPHISEGGYLRLETKVKIEKFSRESADPTIPPPKTSREISTKEIMVPNGSTVVIGGISTQDKSDSSSGTPILSDIPILGWLFRRQQESEENRTLYIFLTPYILYDYSFGDYKQLTRERSDTIQTLRGEREDRLSVEAHSHRLPDSTFRFQQPPGDLKPD